MSIDFAALASTIAGSFLIPYVKIGAEKLAEEAGKKLGEAASTGAMSAPQQIWARVTAAFTSDEDKQALAQLEKRPDAAKPLVEAILTEKLTQDAGLAQELHALVALAEGQTLSTGAQISGAEIAGIADARNAHLEGSSNVIISGVTLTNTKRTDPTS